MSRQIKIDINTDLVLENQYFIQEIRRLNDDHFYSVKQRKKFHVITYGCQMNEHDSEKMIAMLSTDYMDVVKDDISVNIPLPHVPPGSYVTRETLDIANFEYGFQTYLHGGYRVSDEIIEVDYEDRTSETHFIGMAIQENRSRAIEVEEVPPFKPSFRHEIDDVQNAVNTQYLTKIRTNLNKFNDSIKKSNP